MTDEIGIQRHAQYYDALGPVPEGRLSGLDRYRYRAVRRRLLGDSVLDVGCARGDFLRMVRGSHRIAGVEVTPRRAQTCNELLQQDVVIAGNLEQGLQIADQAYDTVVCMEVLEHLADPQAALGELLRISRQRVVVTVPYNERIRYVVCLHCGQRTPIEGHLHSFDEAKLRGMVPPGARLAAMALLGNKTLGRFLPRVALDRMPFGALAWADRALNAIAPRARWLMAILDKVQDQAQDKGPAPDQTGDERCVES